MAVYQLVHTLNYGDAISGEALLIQRLTRERGEQSCIYSVHAHEKVRHEATPWTAYPGGGPDDLLILHYSLGSPLNDLFRAANRTKRALLYHNLTPEHWFRAYNPRVTSDLRRGRAELPDLSRIAHLLLADSSFNAGELRELAGPSAQDVTVLPLAFDPVRWSEPANAGIREVLRGHGGSNILHVGRLAPNKCIEDIIKAFYFYHHKIERRSRLWIIGIDTDTEIYSFELRRLVSELRLKESVSFTGAVSDCELRAFYEHSDLYLSMSEHEGFCLPLLEAMFFGVPVIAFHSCAVPETVGEAGILLARKSPAEVAEVIDLVLTDQGLREQLIAAGRRQVERFSIDVFSRNFEQLLSGMIKPVGTAKAAESGRLSEMGRVAV